MLGRNEKVLTALAAVSASTNHYELLLASDIERDGIEIGTGKTRMIHVYSNLTLEK